jgi:hypothetical protein
MDRVGYVAYPMKKPLSALWGWVEFFKKFSL